METFTEVNLMTEVIQLTDLKKGSESGDFELAVFDDMRRRLQDIGLIEGTVVECVGKEPAGRPLRLHYPGGGHSPQERGLRPCDGI